MDARRMAWGLILAMGAAAQAAQAQQPPAGEALPDTGAADAPYRQGDLEMARFKALDADGDGRVSAAEYLADRRALWEKWSSGGSMSLGACAKAEASRLPAGSPAALAKALEASCARLDAGGKGALSWEQFAMPQWRVFKSLDADGDGFLSPAEFAGKASGLALSHAAKAPKPPAPSEALKAAMARDLAASNAKVKQVKAPSQALPSSPDQPLPAIQEAAPQQPASVYERIQNWLR